MTQVQGTRLNAPRKAHLTIAAEFDQGYFLENLVVRADSSILVTVATKRELWYVPPVNGNLPVVPTRLHTSDELAMAIVEMEPEFFCTSGINGVHYAARSHYLYYTNTAQQLFMRLRVDPTTLEPADEPEFVAGGRMADDFCIDEDAGVAYLATHRQNTIDRLPLEPALNRDFLHNSVAGEPFDELVVGPSSGAWSRGADDYGKVAYFTTDGGTTSPRPMAKHAPLNCCELSFKGDR